MNEGRLEEIKREVESDLYPREAEYALELGKELVAEVERLEGRLQAVCDVLSDADAFDGVIDSETVMEAVRGYRRATTAEMIERIKTAPREILECWIEDGGSSTFIRPDGTFVLEGDRG